MGASLRAASRDVLNRCLTSMRHDAALRDVCFVDASTGWAVGDRGVIWHTADGGATWKQQPSGVTCSLRSVTFINDRLGWAAGGHALPYTGVTQGVLLASCDGGRSWSVTRPPQLAAIRSIRFFDAQRAVAVTFSSPADGTAVFSTTDGGVQWQPMPRDSALPWTAGDFLDPHTGALVGCSGITAAVRGGTLDIARPRGETLRSQQAVVLQPPRFGWSAGDGGLVRRTADLGKSWRAPSGPLPESVARHFDFRAVAVRGRRCWFAGIPGTRVLRTVDAGRTWTMHPTGIRVPLHALSMVDQHTGWAVGALGTILSTRDGGASWHVQRSGGRRVAYLGMFAEPDAVPLEMVAHFSSGLGYLGQIGLIGRPSARRGSSLGPDWRERCELAVAAAGGNGASAAWRFPLLDRRWLPTEQQLRREWDRVTDGRSAQAMEKHMVRAIRMWRPSIVLTAAAEDQPHGYAAGRLIRRAVRVAVEAAADPTRHVDLFQHAQLEPWTVDRVLAETPRQQAGTIRTDAYRLWPRSPQSASDVASVARGFQTRTYRSPGRWLHFRVLRDRAGDARTIPSVFAGIAIASGSGARRARDRLDLSDYAQRKRTGRRQANLRQIIENQSHPAQLAQVASLLVDAEHQTAGNLLFQLAARHARQGQWTMAEEAYRLLVRRFPEHALCDAALVWLVQFHCSSEAALRVARGRTHREVAHALRQSSHPQRDDVPAGDVEERPSADVALAQGVGPQPADSAATALWLDTSAGRRWTTAAGIAKQHRAHRRRLFDHPRIRFPLAAAHRKRGYSRQAQRYFAAIHFGPSRGPWAVCAEGELWLSTRTGPPPKPVTRCPRVKEPPRLDGTLDESCWNAHRPVVLGQQRLAGDRPPAELQLAYDAQFLYVAWRCSRTDDRRNPQPATTHSRDAVPSREDRVELFLDVDRDYVTWYRLSVDHRGQPQAACWGDTSWNPTWHVATDHDEKTWRAEAAIRLDQLCPTPPRRRDAWGLGAQRITPGSGIYAWKTPSPEWVQDRGYLIFE